MGSGNSRAQQFNLIFSLTINRADPIKNQYSEVYPVWSIAVSQNGKQLAATTADHRIHLWCLLTYKILISLVGHGDTVWFVKYSPDNRFLASGSADGTIRLWDVETGFPVSILRAHANWVWTVAFTPDAQYFASGGADSRVFLWNINSALPLLGMQTHAKSIHAIAFSERDSRKMITASADSLIGIWRVGWGRGTKETVTLDLMAKLKGHIGSIYTLAVCPTNENLIASAGEDAAVRFWNLHDLTAATAQKSLDSNTGYNLQHHRLHGHKETIWSLDFCLSGKLLATGSSDCYIRIWNVSANQPTLNCFFRAHESWVRSVCFTDDMQILLSGAADGLVSLWSVPRQHHQAGIPNMRYEVKPEGWRKFSIWFFQQLGYYAGVIQSKASATEFRNFAQSVPDSPELSKYASATRPEALDDGAA